jgi:5-methyltetrahydrofolate--homocysteine methyltransferase
MNELLDALKTAVVEGDADRAAELAAECLGAGLPAALVFEQGIVSGIQEAGVLWDCSRYRVPDVILSADAFNSAVAVIGDRLAAAGDDARPKVMLGVVEGDVHDLGKNILAAMLRGAGLQVVDLGVDVPAAGWVEAVQRERPAVLGIGAYMSSTVLAIPEILTELERAGLRSGLKVLVGGVPTTQQTAESLGADGWAPDANEAVRKVKALLASDE